MSPFVKAMSRHPWTWRVWMALGTPMVASTFALALTWEAVNAMRAAWDYDYRYQWREWFSYFDEKHRLSLHSLGLKPERGGTQMHAPKHVRRADDVQ